MFSLGFFAPSFIFPAMRYPFCERSFIAWGQRVRIDQVHKLGLRKPCQVAWLLSDLGDSWPHRNTGRRGAQGRERRRWGISTASSERHYHGFESHSLRHPGTQQMIEGILSEVESLVYSSPRNLLIYQGIWHFFTSCFSAILSRKPPLKTGSGCLSENTSKSPFQIVLHCPGVCIFPSNSLALAILPAPAWGSDLLR